METHARQGFDILSNHTMPVIAAAAIIAYQHHERWDGNGYPQGLAGEDIHIYGRIVALADVFDALLSKRCYKKAWDIDTVFDYIREQRGLHFDPDLVDLMLTNQNRFVEVIERYGE